MKSIRSKVVIAALVAVVIGASSALYLSDRAYRRTVEAASSDSLVAAQGSFEALRNARIEVMHALMEATVHSREIRTTFAEYDRPALMRLSFPLFELYREEFEITRWYFYDLQEEGCVFLRVYRGERALDENAYGDTSNSKSLARARESGQLESGFEVGRTALSVRVVMPVTDMGGTRIGYIGFGERFEDHLSTIAAQTGDDYAMFLDKDLFERDRWQLLREQQGLADNWDDHETVLLAETTLPDERLLATAARDIFEDTPSIVGLRSLGDRAYAVGTFPILDVIGETVGYVAVFQDVTELRAQFRGAQLGLVLSFLALAIVITIVLVVTLERVVFGRLDSMADRLEHMSLAVVAGEWDALDHEYQQTADDEIGRFEKFFSSFLGLVARALRTRRDLES